MIYIIDKVETMVGKGGNVFKSILFRGIKTLDCVVKGLLFSQGQVIILPN